MSPSARLDRVIRRRLAAAFACAALASRAEAGAEEAAQPAPSAPPRVGMDRLLKLPDSFQVEDARPGGASAAEWRARFEEARSDLDGARSALDQKRKELEEAASGASSWQVTPPGAGGDAAASESSPVSYRLLQEIRRLREEVEHAERRISELQVEANLAGVPEDWRK